MRILFILRDCYLARKVKIYYNSLKKEDLLEEWPVSMILQPVNRSKSYLVCDLIKQVRHVIKLNDFF